MFYFSISARSLTKAYGSSGEEVVQEEKNTILKKKLEFLEKKSKISQGLLKIFYFHISPRHMAAAVKKYEKKQHT